jgi:hypothetical protein
MHKDINLDWLSNCADVWVHSNGHYLCAGLIQLDGDPEPSKPWHYINLPIAENIQADELAAYCRNGQDCVVAQIRQDLVILEDPRIPAQAKQIALMYLIHFVADAHQPLHCADDNDGGGNLKPTDVAGNDGKFLNLHQIWDRAVSNPNPPSNVVGSEAFTIEAGELAQKLETDLANPLSHSSHDIDSWTKGILPNLMVLESFRVAQQVIYPAYIANGGRVADLSNSHAISATYQTQMQRIAYQRIEVAGVRLAFMLDQIFAISPNY